MRLELSLRQSLEQRLELRMQLRQELKQELTLSLQQIQKLLEEFFIKIEMDSDEDQQLVQDSMMFILMHELSHPAYDRFGRYFNGLLAQVDRPYQHHAIEIMVDALGYEAGLSIGESKEELVESHYALAERIYKNTFENDKAEPHLPFLSRIAAELELHSEETKSKRIEELVAKYDKKTEEAFGEQYKSVKEFYKELYTKGRKIASTLTS